MILKQDSLDTGKHVLEINFTYACLNNLINKTGANMMFVLGPGHWFSSNSINIFLEELWRSIIKKPRKVKRELDTLMHNFSWPMLFQAIQILQPPVLFLKVENLDILFQPPMERCIDNPDLIVTCLVGDGENETASSATAWHLSKFIGSCKKWCSITDTSLKWI